MRPIERRFGAGARLFRQGDAVLVVHLVVDGEVHLVRHPSGGAALILQRAAADAVLAEASVFSDRYHCDAVAIVASRTLAVPRAVVRARLAADPDFAHVWAAHLAREVQASRQRAEILSLRTVTERLDAWLVAHGDHRPRKGEWKTVANEIGVSPEALYRELARRRVAARGRRSQM